MRSRDVLIVGGGPAGSACAWRLRRAGIRATILDKNVFPRDKICGGWITPRVLSVLEIDPESYAGVLQPILAFRTSVIGAQACEIDYGKPVSYGVRRREFDHFLLQRAGAEVMEGSALETLERRDGRWIANGSIEARFLIGAGGHFCPATRLLGAKAASESAVVAQEVEFEMTPGQAAACRIRADTPELFFCRDLRGYGWCFRKRDVLNIGLGRADPHRLSSHVRDFFEFLRARIGFDPPAPRGHAYLLYGSSPRRVSGDGWLLAGDAAGLAYPLSGEGILPAIESGVMAADAIASGDPSKYPAMLASRFRTPPTLLERAGARLPQSVLSRIAPGLLRSPGFSRDVVLNRWFLHCA
jgi:geranylgeranyl reductase family protein